MVMPCSRSAWRPSSSSAKSGLPDFALLLDGLQAEIVLLAGIAVERGGLVFLDRLGVPEQPADQRRLAVVDRATGDEAKRTGVTRCARGFECRDRCLGEV
jgi:hypothetical protein